MDMTSTRIPSDHGDAPIKISTADMPRTQCALEPENGGSTTQTLEPQMASDIHVAYDVGSYVSNISQQL